MEVKNIKNPQFLKNLKEQELKELSQDIREYIISSVSTTGGHLSSNLGVVDLTIALHKVFNSPRDKIIFDVSHQCYTHKILTGRANEFKNLSYVLYEVVPRKQEGVILQDKYGFDIIDRYTEVGSFDNVDTNPDNVWTEEEQVKFALFENPYDVLGEDGVSVENVKPVACLFGYSKEDDKIALREDNTDRCLPYSITNNVEHTYQLVIWLEETGDVQEEQGLTFEGTVTIEVSGGVNTNEYVDGEISGEY